MSTELERLLKESVVAYIEAISYLLLAEAEENHLQCFVAY
jgi:hypothetical protein